MPVSWQMGRLPSAQRREFVRIWAIASFGGVVVGDELQRVRDALHEVGFADQRRNAVPRVMNV
jgi:hypothetical protein